MFFTLRDLPDDDLTEIDETYLSLPAIRNFAFSSNVGFNSFEIVESSHNIPCVLDLRAT